MRAAWWWIDRWRQSTAFMTMNAEQRGLYRDLCDAVWLFPNGVIPDNALMSVANATAEEWARSGATVLRWMLRVANGWTNETAMAVRGQSERLHHVRSEAGKRGNAARWGGNASANDSVHPIANGIANASSPSPSPSLSPSQVSVSEQKKERASHAPRAPQPDTGFERFWEAYPRRTGKQAALKVWQRLHPSTTMVDLILQAVAEQRTWSQWTADGGRFIPHPATWLNQGRWDDQQPELLPSHGDQRHQQRVANAQRAVAFIQKRHD